MGYLIAPGLDFCDCQFPLRMTESGVRNPQPNWRHQPLNWRARGVEFRLSFPPWAAFEAPVQGRIGRPWPLNPEPGPFHFRIRGCLTQESAASSTSGSERNTDSSQTSRQVREVPILLQNYFERPSRQH